MRKLPALKPREVAKALGKAGFPFVRQKEGHRIYLKENIAVIIPWHNRDLKKGTLRHIIKQAGLSTKEFLKLHKD